jgi:hypothetical protein
LHVPSTSNTSIFFHLNLHRNTFFTDNVNARIADAGSSFTSPMPPVKNTTPSTTRHTDRRSRRQTAPVFHQYVDASTRQVSRAKHVTVAAKPPSGTDACLRAEIIA